MHPKRKAALHELAHAVRHHLHARQVAEGFGMIPPLQAAQPPQGAPMPPEGGPQPGMPQQPPTGQPGAPMQPQAPVSPASLSKAPPPIDPTQIASIKNRPRNALVGFGTGPGRSAGANATKF